MRYAIYTSKSWTVEPKNFRGYIRIAEFDSCDVVAKKVKRLGVQEQNWVAQPAPFKFKEIINRTARPAAI